MGNPFLQYYRRKDVQQRIVESARGREMGVRYPDGGFGKRPEILQYPSEVFDLAKGGAVSFHMSQERWRDPMILRPGMSRKELDDLRSGFDIIFDIDCKFVDFSKACALLLQELLVKKGIKHVHAKFTGSTGFHVGIPFESFPSVIEGNETKKLFPEMMREAGEYVKEQMLRDLAAVLLDKSDWRDIADATGKKIEELKDKDGRFNPFAVIEIDSIAISSRHMIRSPYSINEKSGRVSIPVRGIKSFDVRQAKMENVDTSLGYLDAFEPGEAKNFLDDVFMRAYKLRASQERKEFSSTNVPLKVFEIPKIAIKDEGFFPPCVKLLLQGVPTDGRKRAVFILINFFRQLGWSFEELEAFLLEWNKKSYEPLRDGYIRSQMNWFKKQNADPRTPGCANESYMKGIGMCKPDGFCKMIKTPAHYALRKVRLQIAKKEKKRVE